ncbi:MAG: hypothetical protein FWC78_03930 [Defluviitaleaceae bacterium]|nr:hypothetical protein [Defluviitaleaceae bacterium]
MKRLNEGFLEKCRGVDFSADCDIEQGLMAIKTKLQKETFMNKRRLRKPFTMEAIVAALMIITGVAVVMGNWYLQREVIFMRGDGTILNPEDGPFVTTGGAEVRVEGSDEVFIIEVVAQDATLEDALGHFPLENPLLPSYMPEGFVLHEAELSTEDDWVALTISYTDGDGFIFIVISSWDSEWGLPTFSPYQEEIEINGRPAVIWDGIVRIVYGNMMYAVNSVRVDEAVRMAVAQGLK